LLTLLPFVRADQLALRDRVLGSGVLDVGDLRISGEAELVGIECEQLEMIMVQAVSLRRAWASIAGLAEVVATSVPTFWPPPIERAEAGMSKTPQCRKVPLGASGSSITSAKLLVPCGGSPHLSAGVWSPPSQLYCVGMD
jgi:hypothetical protein